MKWLKSTTDKSYTAQGKIIPSSNSAPLAVSDTVFESITSMKVIASLIKTGGIIVLDKYRDPQADSSEQRKLQQLQSENTRLADKVRELEASKPSTEVEEKAAKFDELKAEAEQALSAKDTEIDALKAEAEQALSAKDTEIEKLKAELAKAKKSAKKDSE